MATIVTAEWDHEGMPGEAAWAATRDTLLRAFTDHLSPSVQFTLHRMGSAALEADPGLGRIHLTLPNRHHLPFEVARFGIEDRSEVFQPTTEPYGPSRRRWSGRANAPGRQPDPGADQHEADHERDAQRLVEQHHAEHGGGDRHAEHRRR